MPETAYHKRIVDYYRETEHAYRDSWDLENSMAIHYGYRDHKARNFRQSLNRMTEIMMEASRIKGSDHVLDAGCGVGGSSIFLAKHTGCRVTGITLSERQAQLATQNSSDKNVVHLTTFITADYCATPFADSTFDVVWGCESICYAENKEKFIREAYRILKPGGRLIVADGFISSQPNNDHPFIRKWLDGWQVNHLVTPAYFTEAMTKNGFVQINYRNITRHVQHSSKRLFRFYFLAKIYVLWKKLSFSSPPTALQRGNIDACKYQFLAMKRALWEYGIVQGVKPG